VRSSGPLAVVVAAVLERRRANWRDVALVVAARRRSRCVRSGENKERCGGDDDVDEQSEEGVGTLPKPDAATHKGNGQGGRKDQEIGLDRN
jgi:hypothetical protein